MAFKRLGRTEIPALVTSIGDETQAAIVSFSENIHRLDLGYRDKMRVAVLLLKQLKNIGKVAKCTGRVHPDSEELAGVRGGPGQTQGDGRSKKDKCPDGTRDIEERAGREGGSGDRKEGQRGADK